MADQVELSAEVRTVKGKGASRRLRRLADTIPAVIYGAGKEAVSLQLAHKDIFKALEQEAFFSSIVTLNIGGNRENAILKALQRHPAKNRIMHADFLRISMDQVISVEVPIHFINEENCIGVRLGGGSLSHHTNSIQISCLPGILPEFIEVDVEQLEVGEAIHLSDLKLADGLTIEELDLGEEHDHVLVSVISSKTGPDEGDEGDEAPEVEADPTLDPEE